MKWSAFLVAAAAALWPEISAGQPAPTTLPADPSTQDFVTQAARMAMIDLSAAKEAELKSMVKGILNVTMPDGLDPERQQIMKDLNASSGDRFEQKFRSSQIGGQRAALEVFRNYARAGRNSELKSWAQNAAPMLEKHLNAAERLPQVMIIHQG